MRGRRYTIMVAFCMAALPRPAWAVTEIGQCEFVAVSGSGIVTTDLDCSADPVAITVVASGALDLQGHTLSGVDIYCSLVNDAGNCKIRGPGTLRGSIDAGEGVKVSDLTIVEGRVRGRKVTLKGSTISGEAPSGDCAVEVYQEFSVSKLKMRDTTIDGAVCGVDADSGGNFSRVTVTGCAGYGIYSAVQGFGSERVRIKDSTIVGNGGFGIRGTAVWVLDSTVTDNADIGVLARSGFGKLLPRLTISRSDVSRNDAGAALVDQNGFGTKGVKIGKSTIADNARFGVVAGLTTGGVMRIGSSTLTGNASAAECGTSEPCADIGSDVLPDLRKTVCNTSYEVGSGLPGISWDVCALD